MVLGMLAAELRSRAYMPGKVYQRLDLGAPNATAFGGKRRGLASAGLRARLFHGGGKGEESVYLGYLQRRQQSFIGAHED